MSFIFPTSTISPTEISLNPSNSPPLNSANQKTSQAFKDTQENIKNSSDTLIIKNKLKYINRIKRNLTNAIYKNDISLILFILKNQTQFLDKDSLKEKELEEVFQFLLNWAILYNHSKIITKLSFYDLIKNLTEALVYAIKVENLEGVIELLKHPHVDQINLDNYSEILNSLNTPEQIQNILNEYIKNKIIKTINH